LAPGNTYTISWSYLGSESNDVNRFTASGLSFNENNANNNCAPCAASGLPSPQTGSALIGTSVASTTIVPFTLMDTAPTGQSVTNGPGNAVPGSDVANLIFSYATFSGGLYHLTSLHTLNVVFGFNDNGGNDDNHDDFIGVATLISGGNGDPTPLRAALPLFGSVLGGGLLFRRLRNRRQAGAKGAVVLVNLDKVQYQKGPLKRPPFFFIISTVIKFGQASGWGPLVAASRILIVTIFRSVHQGTLR
jgi:hypothetical protein